MSLKQELLYVLLLHLAIVVEKMYHNCLNEMLKYLSTSQIMQFFRKQYGMTVKLLDKNSFFRNYVYIDLD